MSALPRHLSRAFDDTIHGLGRPQGVVVLVATPILACLFLGLAAGERVMSQEWLYVVAALAAIGAVALALLTFNLIAAPFRNVRDDLHAERENLLSAQVQGAALLEENRQLKANEPSLSLFIETAVYGGRSAAYPKSLCLGVVVRLSNAGQRASATRDWGLRLSSPNGEAVGLTHIHTKSEIGFGRDASRSMTIAAGELIYDKAALPVQPGDMVSGFVLAYAAEDEVQEDFKDYEVTVECRDVLDRLVVSPPMILSGKSSENLSYNPRLRANYEGGAA
jgi:hypothetical protein